MAGSATITGTQHYIAGIGHPKTETTTEAPPVMAVIDPFTGKNVLQIGSSEVAIGVRGQYCETIAQPFNGALNTGTANFTFALQVPCVSGEFFAVQLSYQNHSATAQTLDSANVVAVSSDLANGAGLTQTPVTFNGGSVSVTVPACTGTGANIVPGRVLSDVVFIKSIARVDSGVNPLLQVRSYYSGAAAVCAVAAGAAGTLFQFNQLTGQEYASGFFGGASGTNGIAVARSNNIITPAGVIFYTSASLPVLAVVGDSLSTGQGSSGGFLNQQARAAVLSGNKFTPRTLGISGQGHSASYQTGLAVIAEGKAQAIMFWAMSPNDGATQANFDKSWGETLALAQKARAAGIIPIICTSGPVNAWTAPQDAMRQAQNVRVRNLCATGIAVLSENALVLDPTNSGQIFPAYNSGDGLHYSDAGYQAIAEQATTPALRVAGLIP